MKIEVHVKTNSRKEIVEKTDAGVYKVSVNAPPQEGRANEAVVELLAEHFGVSKSCVTLLHGQKSKKKLFEILTDRT